MTIERPIARTLAKGTGIVKTLSRFLSENADWPVARVQHRNTPHLAGDYQLGHLQDRGLQLRLNVHVEGRLQSRSWETKDGDKRVTFEVVAERLQFLGRRPEAAEAAEPAEAPREEVPF